MISFLTGLILGVLVTATICDGDIDNDDYHSSYTSESMHDWPEDVLGYN